MKAGILTVRSPFEICMDIRAFILDREEHRIYVQKVSSREIVEGLNLKRHIMPLIHCTYCELNLHTCQGYILYLLSSLH